MAYAMTFNGTDLGGTTYGLTVLNATPIPVRGEARVHTRDIPGRDGGIAIAGYAESTELEVEAWIEGSSVTDLQSKIDAVNLVCSPRLGPKVITIDEFPGRRWTGVLKNALRGRLMNTGTRVTLSFFCADPAAEASTATSQSVTVNETPEAFNVPASGNIAGSLDAAPVWTLENTHAGGLTGITLTNTTRGESISISQSVGMNEYLRVDVARGVVEYSTDGLSWTIINNKITSSPAAFPRLSPGVPNACTLTGVTAGTLTVSYRARYL